MQLRDYLESEGKGKLNVIAIAWTEGRYGHASEPRLKRFTRPFHPNIRVIRATDAIDKAFQPLVYVPANFFFNSKGNRGWGDGSRHYLDKQAFAKIVESLN